MLDKRHWQRLLCASLLVLAQCPLHGFLAAQESAFVSSRQQLTVLPGHVKSLSMLDGNLYCYTAGLLLQAQRTGEQVVGFLADTVMVRFDEDVDYVVRHPQTGDLYFTKRDRKGRSFLYRIPAGGSGKVESVTLGGGSLFNKGMTVEHPTFSIDGNIMIFSSLEKRRSLGGYDLWYSLFDGKRWGKPENLGSRINTTSDERAPVVYRDCLLFSSNGHKEDLGRMSLYSTRLISDRVVGDTVGMLQIGRCRIQRLPAPTNVDAADDYDIAIDTAAGFGYWLSTRKTSESDSQLFSFAGTLDGIHLWGVVADKQGRALSGVKVSARQGNTVVCNTFSDSEGHYHMYLQTDQFYDFSYQLDNYFVAFETFNSTKHSDEYLIAEARLDVRLDRLPIGERLVYDDLFGPNVDVELSQRGIETLAPLVRFLNDNPETVIDMTLANDLTTDRAFNSLLTDHRIQSLEGYLYPLLPPTVKITIRNLCAGQDGCTAASGVSRLTVLINNEL